MDGFVLYNYADNDSGPIKNKSALDQIMAWRRSGDKPLSEPMMVCLADTYTRHSVSRIKRFIMSLVVNNIYLYSIFLG